MAKFFYRLEDFAEHETYCHVRDVLTRKVPDHNWDFSIKTVLEDYCIDDEVIDGARDMISDWYENGTTGCVGADKMCCYWHKKMTEILEGLEDG